VIIGFVQKVPDIFDMFRWFLQVFHAASEVTVNNFIAHERHHSNTHEISEIESLRIGEQSVPQSYGVDHVEFLAQEEHEPPQTVELVVDLIDFNRVVSMGLYNLHDLGILFYATLNPVFLFIQFPQEPIAQFNHDVGKAEK
jgi:hypothetical protein